MTQQEQKQGREAADNLSISNKQVSRWRDSGNRWQPQEKQHYFFESWQPALWPHPALLPAPPATRLRRSPPSWADPGVNADSGALQAGAQFGHEVGRAGKSTGKAGPLLLPHSFSTLAFTLHLPGERAWFPKEMEII